VRLFHYRTTTGREVDLVLENAAGLLVGIEVKAAGAVCAKDFVGLDALAEDSGGRLRAGIVLYAGAQAVAFGDGRFAMPISALWRLGGGGGG
jgi:predicted AAA+ superfamily ATPase